VQDEVTVITDRLKLMLGSKFEHNDYTGYEIQPSGRLTWTPAENHTVWAAVSRAVRTPSRIEADGSINLQALPPNTLFPGSPVALVRVSGSHDFDSEELLAYELGYRVTPHARLNFDAALFYHDYSKLRTSTPSTPVLEMSPLPPHLVVPAYLNNAAKGETYGAELIAQWQASDWWWLTVDYTFLRVMVQTTSPTVQSVDNEEGNAPQHQVGLRSRMNLLRGVEFDLGARYVDGLAAKNIDGYFALDARLGWQITKNLEVSVVGRSLLDNQHPEWSPVFIQSQPTEVEHSIYGKVTVRF
jgi:iron complex outermembrane receptor protein